MVFETHDDHRPKPASWQQSAKCTKIRLSEVLWAHTYLSFRAPRGISLLEARFFAEPVLRETIQNDKQSDYRLTPQFLTEPKIQQPKSAYPQEVSKYDGANRLARTTSTANRLARTTSTANRLARTTSTANRLARTTSEGPRNRMAIFGSNPR